MTGEDRVRSTDLGEARSTQRERADSVALGLIAAPEIPERIARKLGGELPGLLSMSTGVSPGTSRSLSTRSRAQVGRLPSSSTPATSG